LISCKNRFIAKTASVKAMAEFDGFIASNDNCTGGGKSGGQH